MLHVLILRPTAPAGEAAPYAAAHADYLERYHDQGVFLASGRTGAAATGAVILARGSSDRVQRITEEDPYVRAGVAAYEVVSAAPARLHPDMAALFSQVDRDSGGAADHDAWTTQEYFRLRPDSPDLAAGLADRPLHAVLQRAGGAVLGALPAHGPDLAEQARRCAAGLRERDWAGDGLLADELAQALADQPEATALAPAAVDLEMLAEALDGDPADGEGLLDLSTGDVWPAAAVEVEPPPELEEEDIHAPERWLAVPTGSRAAYKDMADFAETMADTRLGERLHRALDGRGPFRRFKDAIHDAEGAALTAWTIFSAERAAGRARAWLADQGYRPRAPDQPR